MEWMTPVGRGFDTSFGYLGGAEDHFKHTNKEAGCEGVDLWDSDRPANRSTWDGVYSSHMYNHQVKAVIQEHGARQRNQATHERQPSFLYVTLQDMHAPNEVPAKYSRQFSKYTDDFGLYNGMGTAADDVFGNMTAALHHQGLYNNTLIVMVRASCCVVALTWGMSGERQRWPCCDDRVRAHGQCTVVVFILIATAFVVVVSSCCDAELAVEGWQANGAWGGTTHSALTAVGYILCRTSRVAFAQSRLSAEAFWLSIQLKERRIVISTCTQQVHRMHLGTHRLHLTQ